MPPFETMDRYQKAVLWEATGFDGYGERIVAAPVELLVRWVNHKRNTNAPLSDVTAFDATVVTNRSIPVGSEMWLGSLDDWYGSGSAGDDTEVMKVVVANRTTSIHNRFTRWTHRLTRFRDDTTED